MKGGNMVSRVAARVRRKARAARNRRSIRHLHGPKGPGDDPREVVVVALVRDGMFYLEEFLAHYRALGAGLFVFCDNGSADGTLDRLRAEPDTVILQSLEPWGHMESDFRRHAAERYAAGRWCLYADMDEMLDFEGAAEMGLRGLTARLEARGHTALVAQMLDLFPDRPLREVASLPYSDVLAQFVHYEPDYLLRQAYHDPAIDFSYFLQANEVTNPAIKVFSGGVRARVFGEMCCLTKHPLVHVVGDVVPGVHPHCATNVRCADFTAVIRHYKFANDPAARDADVARRQAILHGDDHKRLSVFDATPDLTLHTADCRRLLGLDQLYDEGFLIRAPAGPGAVPGAAGPAA